MLVLYIIVIGTICCVKINIQIIIWIMGKTGIACYWGTANPSILISSAVSCYRNQSSLLKRYYLAQYVKVKKKHLDNFSRSQGGLWGTLIIRCGPSVIKLSENLIQNSMLEVHSLQPFTLNLTPIHLLSQKPHQTEPLATGPVMWFSSQWHHQVPRQNLHQTTSTILHCFHFRIWREP
jgi:hypothetical protein